MEHPRADDLLIRLPWLGELRAARNAVHASGWLVGGCVRDLLLDRLPVDIDIASTEPEALARQFAQLINGRVVPMDTVNGVWRVAISSRQYVDFCRYRDNDLLGDLQGRDFTFNAIAIELRTANEGAEFFDPCNGISDLHERRLRMVSPNTFIDDPARVLRAFRFVAELDAVIDEATRQALQAAGGLLANSAPERLLTEWWKLCAGMHAATAIRQMDDLGVLSSLFPEFLAMKGVVQNAYHHLDVWGHTMLAIGNMAQIIQHPKGFFNELTAQFAPLLTNPHTRARLFFLALLHDIGKPATRTVDHGKVHFYGHEVAGASIASCICERLRASKEDCRVLCTVIRHHLRPLFMMHDMKNGRLSTKTMIKFFDETGEQAREIMILAMADKLAGRGLTAEPDIDEHLRVLYRKLLAFYHAQYRPAIDTPVITGDDLVRDLGISPGPRVGQLLEQIRNRQITGQLTTRKKALQWVERHR